MDKGVLFLGIVAIVVAIVGPYFAELAKWLVARCSAPKLRVEFANKRPYCHLTTTRYGTSKENYEWFPTYYFMFCIHNLGKSSARRCQVFLEEICSADSTKDYHRDNDFWPTRLTWEERTAYQQIHPGSRAFVSIGHIPSPEAQPGHDRSMWIGQDPTDNERFMLDLCFHHFAKRDYLEKKKKHHLKIAIVGENFNRIEKQFELSWSGYWTEKEEEMIEKEAVLKLCDSRSAGIIDKFLNVSLGCCDFFREGRGSSRTKASFRTCLRAGSLGVAEESASALAARPMLGI